MLLPFNWNRLSGIGVFIGCKFPPRTRACFQNLQQLREPGHSHLAGTRAYASLRHSAYGMPAPPMPEEPYSGGESRGRVIGPTPETHYIGVGGHLQGVANVFKQLTPGYLPLVFGALGPSLE